MIPEGVKWRWLTCNNAFDFKHKVGFRASIAWREFNLPNCKALHLYLNYSV